ncbi:hypothetical protein QYF36_007425 [Acer negundo]|nr:hypothetical protein QYF36_007425 [Acer negundo]
MESEHHRRLVSSDRSVRVRFVFLSLKLQFEISISLSRNGERATVDVVAAVDARSGTVYGGFIDRSSRRRFGLLDLQISY